MMKTKMGVNLVKYGGKTEREEEEVKDGWRGQEHQNREEEEGLVMRLYPVEDEEE